MKHADLSLDFNEDPEFDRLLAAAVRFGEIRIQEELTPGEIELEMMTRGVDEQVVGSAMPHVEVLYERHLLSKGFKTWRKKLPLTGLWNQMGEGIAEFMATIALALASGALVWMLQSILLAKIFPWIIILGAFLLTPITLYILTYILYLVAWASSIPKVKALRRQLERVKAGTGDPPSSAPGGPGRGIAGTLRLESS